MRNTWLVIRREYLERVRTRSFIVSTILMPAFMFAVTVLPTMLASRKSKQESHIVVAANYGTIAAEVAKQLQSPDSEGNYKVESRTVAGDDHNQLDQEVSSNKIDGYILLTDSAIAAGRVTYAGSNTSDFVADSEIRGAVNAGVRRARLQAKGMSAAEADELMKPVQVETIKIEGGKQKAAGGPEQFIATFGFAFVIYMMLIMYGMATMRSVLEEKTSRVMEVMLSCVTPKELMAGKVIGVGAVGLTQIAIWVVSAAILSGPQVAASSQLRHALNFGPGPLIALPVFFVLGFLLYSSMYAALGAMVNSEQEAQQWQWFVTMPLIIPIIMITEIIRRPDSMTATWMSLVPFFSPILMFVRIVAHTPPVWQIAASVVLLIIATWLIILLCSRIYRVGILMYGKRPTLPEIVKWVRYA